MPRDSGELFSSDFSAPAGFLVPLMVGNDNKANRKFHQRQRVYFDPSKNR
jgi:hypothetical protein